MVTDMRKFVINSLAQSSQCQSMDKAEVILGQMIDCFDYLLPALLHHRAVLLHDSRQDFRSLVVDESFHTTIANLSGKNGPILRRKWFLYTKNRAKKLTDETIDVTLSASDPNVPGSVQGQIDKSVHREEHSFISFGGSTLLESACLQIDSCHSHSTHPNAHDRASLSQLLPQYHPSSKHRKESYFDHVRKEHVAAMPLTNEEAQEILLKGIEQAGDYWSYHHGRDSFFRFKLTLGNEYHGFIVSLQELPPDLAQRLKSP